MKTLALILTYCLFSFFAYTQTLYPNGVPSCIARWTFDEDETLWLDSLDDFSNNNNLGVTTNIASVSGFRNKPNKAGGFDGTSSMVEVPHKPMLNPTNITLVAVVKFNSFYSGSCQGNNIIYKGYDYNNNLSWSMYVAENDGDCIAINPSIQKLNFCFPSIPLYTPPFSNFIDTGKWYFLAITYDGNFVNHYQLELDSTIKYSSISPMYVNTINYPLGNSNDNIFIGVTQNPPFKYWFNGSMDELVIFNRALSNSEVKSIYDYIWGYPTRIDMLNETKILEPTIKINHGVLSLASGEEYVKEIEVLDLNGKKLTSSINNKLLINVSDYPQGIYLVKIILTNNTIITKKIIYSN
jgi:hypothetical protein